MSYLPELLVTLMSTSTNATKILTSKALMKTSTRRILERPM